MKKKHDAVLYTILVIVAFLTMVPFLFVLNNSLRTNMEMYHSFFGLPKSLTDMVRFSWYELTAQRERIMLKIADEEQKTQQLRASELEMKQLSYGQAMAHLWNKMTKGYKYALQVLRPYMLNTFFVCIATAFGVLMLGSVSAYIFARYRFPGRQFLFLLILSIMMIPGVLTLVPSFLLVKKLGLLNSYWVLVLPYVAGGQIFAIFLFRGFFEGLPEELFESARLDGASHFALYWNIVLPLSKQVMAVVLIMNILGTWNNFLWPFITNSDAKYHVVASGLYLMGQSQVAANFSTMFAGYMLSSIPLLILFIYGTKHFITGITSGAFKA